MKYFNIGDVVKVDFLEDGDELYYLVGDKGTVITDNKYLPCARFENGEYVVFSDQLSLVRRVP